MISKPKTRWSWRRGVFALLAVLSAETSAGAQIRVPIADPALVTTTSPTVNGNPPSGVTVSGTGQNVTVRWTLSTGAISYVVIRTNPDGTTALRTPTPITTNNFSETIPTLAPFYRYQVGVRWLDGTYGLSTLVPYVLPGPKPSSITSSALNGRVTLNFTGSSAATEYFIYRNGTWAGSTQACTACSYGENVAPGTTYSYAIDALFPVNSGYSSTSRSDPTSITVPHYITFSPTTYLVARNSRVDFAITNTANPDGSRGGLVTGTGNGVSVNDPGLNKLAMITTANAPLGIQNIQLSGTNMAPATVQAVIMRTPGTGALALPGVASKTFPGTASSLRMTQLNPNRWSATFNALPAVDLERDGDWGGATFCASSDAVGVVLSANGKRLGLSSPWGIVLQELNRTPVPPPHVLETQRYSPDGKIGLVPMIYLTPDCTLAVIVDVIDSSPSPYRIRMYDLLARQLLGSAVFATSQVTYTTVHVELFVGNATAMQLFTSYPGNSSSIPIPQRAY